MILFFFVSLLIGCFAAAGYCIGYATAAKKAAAEHRQAADDFAALSAELKDLQSRVREHTG